jgi:hypothetical protein
MLKKRMKKELGMREQVPIIFSGQKLEEAIDCFQSLQRRTEEKGQL